MKISITYPEGAVKLYHLHKGGKLIKLCNNDGTSDDNLYIVGQRSQKEKCQVLINVVTGEFKTKSVSARCLVFEEAVIAPFGFGEE